MRKTFAMHKADGKEWPGSITALMDEWTRGLKHDAATRN